MQAASAQGSRLAVLGFRLGSVFPFAWVRFTPVTAFDPAFSAIRNPGARPFELYALLLLALPSVLTRQKLLELLELTERQKTFAVEPSEGAALPSGTFSKTHPNYSFSFPVTLQDVPQQGFLLVDQFAQALGHAVQLGRGLTRRHGLSLAVCKAPLRVL